MKTLGYYLKRYPNRIKYGLIMVNLFAMIFAIRMYVNYVSIENTIENTILERQNKMAELAFSQNFLIHYERSEFAKYFLQHENNMLMPGEYIIKFVENTKKIGTWSTAPGASPKSPSDPNLITSPQASRKRFLQDKFK